MACEGGTSGDSNVIHVYANGSTLGHVLCNDFFIDLVHHCLESGGGIAKNEKKNRGVGKAIAFFERRLVFVPLFDAYIIVPPPHVQFGEYGCSPKIGEQVGNE